RLGHEMRRRAGSAPGRVFGLIGRWKYLASERAEEGSSRSRSTGGGRWCGLRALSAGPDPGVSESRCRWVRLPDRSRARGCASNRLPLGPLAGALRASSPHFGDFRRIGSDLLGWWRRVLRSWGKLAKRPRPLVIADSGAVDSRGNCPRGHTRVAPQTWTLHTPPGPRPQLAPEVLDTRGEQPSPTSCGQHPRSSASHGELPTGPAPEIANIS